MTPQRAQNLAECLHENQRDKGGAYFQHLMRVVAILRKQGETEEDLFVVAWLHDVLEDTGAVARDLALAGVTFRQLYSIRQLTRRQSETYREYIRRVAGNGPLSLEARVKRADLIDHLRLDGPLIEPSLRERYELALEELDK